uniref:limulus clotting factor C n=1 Tax=Hadronyche cerberea TaxID=1107879 RepID=A0A4Q8K383_HADCE
MELKRCRIHQKSWIFLCSILFGFTSGLRPDLKKEDARPLCECGSNVKPLQTRVVGGKNAAPGDFPYATGLLSSGDEYLGRRIFGLTGFRPYCGGTLVTDRHVVTAAHCVRERISGEITLDIGEYDLEDQKQGRTLRNSKSLKLHPKYKAKTFNSDIALIELSRPVKLGTNIKAAWLPPQDADIAPGTPVTVYGWGRLGYNSGRPKVLQTLQIPLVSRSECQKKLVSRITPNMLCAGGEEGKDACIGDSGSGLTVKRGDENVLVGIVSFGRKCALPGVAGVYTKVSNFVDWIYENTRSSGCQPCIASLEDFVLDRN